MGIYDRDYIRQARSAPTLSTPRTVVGWLILINVVVYLVDWVLLDGKLTGLLRAGVGILTQPLQWYRFVTYGFLHARSPEHIVLNMLGLFFLARDIEELYGSKEFLRIYLALLVFGGVSWAAVERLQGTPESVHVVGASGAISGIVILYALNFPRRMLALFFVLPVPAWFAGVLLVVLDAHGAITRPDTSQIAYLVHLGGAAMALLYYGLGWNFGQFGLDLRGFVRRRLRWRPKLRVFPPDEHKPEPHDNLPEKDLAEEVDRILEKISREGEASLTRQERRTLETASRQYQKRRQSSNGPTR